MVAMGRRARRKEPVGMSLYVILSVIASGDNRYFRAGPQSPHFQPGGRITKVPVLGAHATPCCPGPGRAGSAIPYVHTNLS